MLCLSSDWRKSILCLFAGGSDGEDSRRWTAEGIGEDKATFVVDANRGLNGQRQFRRKRLFSRMQRLAR